MKVRFTNLIYYKCEGKLYKMTSYFLSEFFTFIEYLREQEINKVPKFCTAIFYSVEAKNADIPIGMVSIFNEK
jgi:hypothetical protein